MNLLQILKDSINTLYVRYIGNDEIENLPIYYIGGSQTLPPPLSTEEENEILEKLSNGDNSVRQTLVERNLRLVVYIAKKFENTGVGIEDLISIGTIGLMKAINTFNTNKNIKLATYASRCIENEILMYLRRSNKIKGEISIDEPLNQDGDGNELLLSDILGTDPDITSRRLEDEVDKTLLRASIEKLTNRERNIMELRFGFISGIEKTQKEVADMLRNFAKLHITPRKEDYKQNEKGNYEQNWLGAVNGVLYGDFSINYIISHNCIVTLVLAVAFRPHVKNKFLTWVKWLEGSRTTLTLRLRGLHFYNTIVGDLKFYTQCFKVAIKHYVYSDKKSRIMAYDNRIVKASLGNNENINYF